MKTSQIITTAIAVGALAAGTIGGSLAGFGIGRTTAPTPDACLVALDESERALSLAGDALLLAGDGIVAAAAWDAAEMTRITGEIDEITVQLDDPSIYLDAQAECRGETR